VLVFMRMVVIMRVAVVVSGVLVRRCLSLLFRCGFVFCHLRLTQNRMPSYAYASAPRSVLQTVGAPRENSRFCAISTLRVRLAAGQT
jgi:hypothetical protein